MLTDDYNTEITKEKKSDNAKNTYFCHKQDEGHSDLYKSLKKEIKDYKKYSDIVMVFIGTDRSTGDSFAPLIGTQLLNKLKKIKIHGHLDSPIHALNLEQELKSIFNQYENPFIIGVDACLGKESNIGKIAISNEPIKPGAALNKNLPEVGQVSLKGVVNASSGISGLNQICLSHTRLSLIMNMSTFVSKAIILLDKNLHINEKRSINRKNSKCQDLYHNYC